jgi:hypothetical protein
MGKVDLTYLLTFTLSLRATGRELSLLGVLYNLEVSMGNKQRQAHC